MIGIFIDNGRLDTRQSHSKNHTINARDEVTARFTFRSSKKDVPARQLVGFPDVGAAIKESERHAPNGDNVLQVNFFEYIVDTGGPWKGPIGGLVANVTLKGGLTLEDLGWPKNAKDDTNMMLPPRADWRVVSPSSMCLEWKQFEPRTDAGKQFFRIASKPAKIPLE